MPAYTYCRACNGGGVGRSGDTSSNCSSCRGSGEYIARDEYGRFLSWKQLHDSEVRAMRAG